MQNLPKPDDESNDAGEALCAAGTTLYILTCMAMGAELGPRGVGSLVARNNIATLRAAGRWLWFLSLHEPSLSDTARRAMEHFCDAAMSAMDDAARGDVGGIDSPSFMVVSWARDINATCSLMGADVAAWQAQEPSPADVWALAMAAAEAPAASSLYLRWSFALLEVLTDLTLAGKIPPGDVLSGESHLPELRGSWHDGRPDESPERTVRRVFRALGFDPNKFTQGARKNKSRSGVVERLANHLAVDPSGGRRKVLDAAGDAATLSELADRLRTTVKALLPVIAADPILRTRFEVSA